MTKAEFVRIIQQSQKGDRAEFERIYKEYFGKIRTTAYFVVKDFDLAYDIASEVILKLLIFRKDPTEIENHTAYIIRMTKNLSFDLIEKRNHEVSSEIISEKDDASLIDPLWLDDIMKLLSEEEKDIFVLHYIWDRPFKKISAQLNIPWGTVKARAAKIRQKLKSYYEERRK